jgi:ABC-type sugar transport system ATPase subunit
VPELTVAENLFHGREPRDRLGRLDAAAMRREARRWLSELGLELDPDRPVRRLRVAERQLLEVAKALSLEARVLVMDEPTSALNPAEVERLFAVIRRLRASGVAVVYISHRLDEVFALADRVTVLRDGRLVGSSPIGDLTRPGLIRMMVGRELTDLFPTSPRHPGPEALRVEGLGLSGGRRPLEDVTFSVRAGEVVGLAGLLGAGRTELLETLFGVPHPSRVRGRVWLEGRPLRPAGPRDAIRSGLGFVTEDRKGQSLIPVRSVRENASLVALSRFTRGPVLDLAAERRAVGELVRDLRVRTPGLEARVGGLSGGNQQKVALAKFLLVRPKVLLLDEPSQGIDVGAKAEIYALVDRLAAAGTAVLLASSEMPELLALCDRVLVLCEGRLAGELGRAEATQERILELATRFRAAPPAGA